MGPHLTGATSEHECALGGWFTEGVETLGAVPGGAAGHESHAVQKFSHQGPTDVQRTRAARGRAGTPAAHPGGAPHGRSPCPLPLRRRGPTEPLAEPQSGDVLAGDEHRDHPIRAPVTERMLTVPDAEAGDQRLREPATEPAVDTPHDGHLLAHRSGGAAWPSAPAGCRDAPSSRAPRDPLSRPSEARAQRCLDSGREPGRRGTTASERQREDTPA